MRPRALVVDDDPDILHAVRDILDSLDHDHDSAESVETAREHLGRQEYTYILLDLEIPVRARRNLPRIQNGENLLEEIVGRRGASACPAVIVMTAHGTDGPELAVDVMKKGACDYVTKPFKTSGRTLDKSIRQALERLGVPAETRTLPVEGRPTEPPLGPELKAFEAGKMTFFSDRVELCGVDICSGPRASRMRNLLELLREERAGKRAVYSGKKLAEKLGLSKGETGVAGLIRVLRARIKEALRQLGFACEDDDVIVSGGPGYRLSAKLSVQEGTAVTSGPDQGHDDEDGCLNVPDHVPNIPDRVPNFPDANVPDVPDPDVPNVPDDGAGARRTWILARLDEGHPLQAPIVAKQYKCSNKTAQRDLTALKDDGIIEFVGSRRSGYYRLRQLPGNRP